MATKKQTHCLFIVSLLFISVFCCTTWAADWPNYRGPGYNGISQETDWQSDWGASGPKKLWQKSVGIGFSSTVVADGRAYTMGNTGKKGNLDIVYCFDAKTGKELWTHTYACDLAAKYYEGGTLSTPTVDGKRIYTLSKMGDLFCLNAKTGAVIWQKELNKKLGYKLPTWHLSSSALIIDDMLVVNVGTAGLALNKNTGDLIWENGKEKCGYATPIAFTMEGTPSLAIFAEKSIVAVKQANGKRIWEYPWVTKYEVNAADPIITGDKVFISSGYNRGATLISVHDDHVHKVWESKVIRTQMNCVVLWKGYLYGFDEKELKCIHLDSGEEQWSDKSLGKGSLMMSKDERMILISDKGELAVAQADPKAFKVLSRAQVLPKSKCWTSPVLANGRVYVRNAAGDFACLDLR
jgi:outer membrane protein assembly factor BamB